MKHKKEIENNVKTHNLTEVDKRTIGEKMMTKEYNGLTTRGTDNIERVRDLIDELTTFMDEGDNITITGLGNREFDVVIKGVKHGSNERHP